MARYSVTHATAVGTDLPIINTTGSADIHVRLYFVSISFSSSPADVATLFVIERTTDVGTGGTSLTENPIDTDTVTQTGAAVGGTFSAAPTDSDELFQGAFNQRASHIIQFPERAPLMSTPSANNGIMLNSESSGGTPTCECTKIWEE